MTETNVITLIGNDAKVTVMPMTETLGTVAACENFDTVRSGDLVSIPDWFLSTVTTARNETYWQAAGRPYGGNGIKETLLAPQHLCLIPIVDVLNGDILK